MKRLRSERREIDSLDADILFRLAADARMSTADLAREVGLSPPSVAERIKRLEESNVIRGYTAIVDPEALGLPLAVHIRIRPMPGQVGKLATLLNKLDAIVECDRITGDDCFVAKAHVGSVRELEALIDKIIPLGTTNTAIIQSSPVMRRLPPLPSKQG
jgi:Lrp/AsnC family leucine-responsive transcriptional regulator